MKLSMITDRCSTDALACLMCHDDIISHCDMLMYCDDVIILTLCLLSVRCDTTCQRHDDVDDDDVDDDDDDDDDDNDDDDDDDDDD